MVHAILVIFCIGAVATAVLAVRAARRRRRDERRRQVELLERLAAGLAHELKNPLSALNLNVQLLEEELDAAGALTGASRARLATIKREYRRLEDVLNVFLRYASRRQLSLTEVDLNVLVEDLLTFVKPEFHRRGVSLETEFSQAPLPSSVDGGLIKQALLNILLNALDATPSGGSVAIRTSRQGPDALITVRDTGTGIAPEDEPRIFDAYFSRKKDGTGLGLAITKRIIDDHNGRIDVESAPGKGTAFTIALPAKGPVSRGK